MAQMPSESTGMGPQGGNKEDGPVPLTPGV